jgi:hypothetical protein
MAELSRIALIIMEKAILLLERSRSLINFHSYMGHRMPMLVFEHLLNYLPHRWKERDKVAGFVYSSWFFQKVSRV